MVRKIFFRHQKSLRHLAMTLTKYSISAHLGAPRRGLRGDVMVTCHGTKTRHGNTAKNHINVMVFPYRRERTIWRRYICNILSALNQGNNSYNCELAQSPLIPPLSAIRDPVGHWSGESAVERTSPPINCKP